MTIELPIRIESEANLREHWAKKAKRAREQRLTVHYSLTGARRPVNWPLVVTLTRIAPRALDTDNLARGFKAVRDAVAAWLGIDDGSERIVWRYGQEKGLPRVYCARLTITHS